MEQSSVKTLPLNVRIIIGIAAVPSLLLALMLLLMIFRGEYTEIGAFEVIYSLVGFVAAYIALSGKRLF